MKEMILVAVGGSGARVAQSVVALAAAGFADRLVRDDKGARLTIRLVDIDINHDDGMDLRDMIISYNNAFGFLWNAKSGVQREGWRPLEIVLENDNSFFFGTGFHSGTVTYANIKEYIERKLNVDASSKPLIDALYGSTDQTMSLYCGCKGHPHIGSLLWDYLYDERYTPFWSSIVTTAGSPDAARIMFAGSLFGGTGASGVPTLAKRLKVSLENCPDYKIGLTLMAPYFYLNDAPDRVYTEDEVEVDFTQFGFQSKLALNYYMLEDVLPSVECIQVVGSDEQTMCEGDGTATLNRGDSTKTPQNDPAVPAELVAAIGILRYFAGVWEKGVFVPKETGGRAHDWQMLPLADKARDSLQQLERFCLMTRDYFTPIALQKTSAHHPTFMEETWKESAYKVSEWASVWKGTEQGIGAALDFSERMLRYFQEMDRNGLAVLNTDKYAVALKKKSKHGQTAGIDLQGIHGRSILGVMNRQVPRYYMSREHIVTPNNPGSDAYTLALMDACETPYVRRGN